MRNLPHSGMSILLSLCSGGNSLSLSAFPDSVRPNLLEARYIPPPRHVGYALWKGPLRPGMGLHHEELEQFDYL